uniref:Uncharacterized protein n=1 Tax=Neobodo designis TaxID=312471 RepID=A0A7S1R352_NEODS|mmetsp:Transcript_759/g.2634  ORF Transcript_759/g.2634 Transcript_759/m.2634 type:complete len:415 (+) Transcript_759:144-1388(+)
MGCAASVDTPERTRQTVTVKGGAYTVVSEPHPALRGCDAALHADHASDGVADSAVDTTPTPARRPTLPSVVPAADEGRGPTTAAGAALGPPSKTASNNADAAVPDATAGMSEPRASSDGAVTDEPSDFSRSAHLAVNVIVSRVRHGINGDPDQFYPDREPAATVDASVKSVRKWMAEIETAEATPPNAGRRVSSPDGFVLQSAKDGSFCADGPPLIKLPTPMMTIDTAGAGDASTVSDVPQTATSSACVPRVPTGDHEHPLDAICSQDDPLGAATASGPSRSPKAHGEANRHSHHSPGMKAFAALASPMGATGRRGSVGMAASVRSAGGPMPLSPLSRAALAAHDARLGKMGEEEAEKATSTSQHMLEESVRGALSAPGSASTTPNAAAVGRSSGSGFAPLMMAPRGRPTSGQR